LLGRWYQALDLLLRQLPADEVVSELRTLVGAGSTTVHLLTWLAHLLGRHGEVQARLRASFEARLRPVFEPSVADPEAIPLSRQRTTKR